MWSKERLNAVYDAGLGLSLKQSRRLTGEGAIDCERDFSVTFPNWALLDDIKDSRHVFVCMKDALKLRQMELERVHGPFKGPKSSYLKTIMLWLKEEEYKTRDASMAELFTDCLEKLLEAYETFHLRHFLIPEVNLLDDRTEVDRLRSMQVLQSILDDPFKYLFEAYEKPMEGSRFLLVMFKGAIDSMQDSTLKSMLSKHVEKFNYDDHDPDRETKLEKALTKEFFEKFWTLLLVYYRKKNQMSDDRLLNQMMKLVEETPGLSEAIESELPWPLWIASRLVDQAL